MTRYFLEIIDETWNSNNVIKFEIEKIWLHKNPSHYLPIFTDIKYKLDEKNKNYIK